VAKADFEKAKREFPSTAMGEPEWLAFFDTPEGRHAMGRIMGDIYDFVKAEEEKESGVRRMGRRPSRNGSLQDVYDTIFPAPYSMDPFPQALEKLLAGRSHRQFAPKIPVHQTTLGRLMKGSLEPDLVMLERIAAAAKVSPSYFVEYRAHFVGQLLTRVFIERPNLGVKAFREVKMGPYGGTA
jgi:hypothetical protein